MAYLQTIEYTGKFSTDQTGRFPVTSSRGSKYLMVLYYHDRNAISSEPLTSRNECELIRSNRILHAYLSNRGLTPQYQILDSECPGGLKTFLRKSSVKFQLCQHSWIETGSPEEIECQGSMWDEAVPEMQG